MNGLDLVILGLAAAAAVGGYRLGFVTRMTSWLGMVIGIVIASVWLPSVIGRLDRDIERADLLFVAAAMVVGGGLLGQAVGLFVGSRLHLAIPVGRARQVDAGVGAVAGVLGVAVVAWLLVPAMADVPGWPARQARGSTVLRATFEVLPDVPDTTRSLRSLLGDGYPAVFDTLRPTPELGPPPASGGLSQALTDTVTASTVLVAGEACDQVQEGSGFVVGENLVATNAHVVAGESTTEVRSSDGARHAGRVVAFDPDRDVAIIRVDGLDRPALPLGDATEGDQGAVFGHPGGGPLRLAPYAVGERIVASGADIYDEDGVEREVLVLASALRPGDSGSALVSPAGEVVGLAFAIAPDRPGVAYALSTAELRAVLDLAGNETVSAGACLA